MGRKELNRDILVARKWLRKQREMVVALAEYSATPPKVLSYFRVPHENQHSLAKCLLNVLECLEQDANILKDYETGQNNEAELDRRME